MIDDILINEKYERLKIYLKDLGNVAIAFSGGVDSTFLLKVAHDVLKDNAVAVTTKACLFPEKEFIKACDFCKKEKIKHLIYELDVLEIDGFSQNPKDRCYICKKKLLSEIKVLSYNNNIKYIAEGSNIDDDNDYRPGLCAVEELGIKSPLRYAKLNKEEIRKLSKKLGLDTWKKQSLACLASRFMYGETITMEKLNMIDKAEQFLFDNGFYQVRVRIHDKMARIEVMPNEFQKLMDIKSIILYRLKELGFTYVTMDLEGYRTGSMNETL